MPISRIFQPTALSIDAIIELDAEASHHIARVLRAHLGDKLIIFNGEGGEYIATIVNIDKKCVYAQLETYAARETESPLRICLAQGISRGEKMDYTIQKAVELGVWQIIPLLTERCTVKLDADRRQKRTQHWQSIIVSACEQSGRNRIPQLLPIQTLPGWLSTLQTKQAFVLSPHAEQGLDKITIQQNLPVTLLIGPEGGLSQSEIEQAYHDGFIPLCLGPRILRTETAALAAITALQCYFGDMGK